MEKTLKQRFEEVANAYLFAFCKKHGFNYEDTKRSWVGNHIGDTVLCGDYYVDFDDIRIDIDREVPEEEFSKYYDYSMEAYNNGFFCPNYDRWLRGCPRLSEEQINEIRTRRHKIEKMKEELKETIKEYEQNI